MSDVPDLHSLSWTLPTSTDPDPHSIARLIPRRASLPNDPFIRVLTSELWLAWLKGDASRMGMLSEELIPILQRIDRWNRHDDTPARLREILIRDEWRASPAFGSSDVRAEHDGALMWLTAWFLSGQLNLDPQDVVHGSRADAVCALLSGRERRRRPLNLDVRTKAGSILNFLRKFHFTSSGIDAARCVALETELLLALLRMSPDLCHHLRHARVITMADIVGSPEGRRALNWVLVARERACAQLWMSGRAPFDEEAVPAQLLNNPIYGAMILDDELEQQPLMRAELYFQKASPVDSLFLPEASADERQAAYGMTELDRWLNASSVELHRVDGVIQGEHILSTQLIYPQPSEHSQALRSQLLILDENPATLQPGAAIAVRRLPGSLLGLTSRCGPVSLVVPRHYCVLSESQCRGIEHRWMVLSDRFSTGTNSREVSAQRLHLWRPNHHQRFSVPAQPRRPEPMLGLLLRPLLTYRALKQEGIEQEHCLAYCSRQALHAEDRLYFAVTAPERATLEIEWHGGRWHVSELRLRANGTPRAETRALIECWLLRA